MDKNMHNFDNYTARSANIDDYSAIMAIKLDIHREAVRLNPQLYKETNRPFSENYLERHFQGGVYGALVAESEGRVIGYLLYERVEVTLPMMKHRRYIMIEDIATDKRYRNIGVASLLIERIDLEDAEFGAASVELSVHATNVEACKLYEKLGYAVRSYRMERFL